MNRARAAVALLSIVLWQAATPLFVTFLPVSVAHGTVIAADQEEGGSAWIPNPTGTAELVSTIRGSQLRLCTSHRPVASFEDTRRLQGFRPIAYTHRSPYPSRHQLRLRFSRSENGDLPH